MHFIQSKKEYYEQDLHSVCKLIWSCCLFGALEFGPLRLFCVSPYTYLSERALELGKLLPCYCKVKTLDWIEEKIPISCKDKMSAKNATLSYGLSSGLKKKSDTNAA